MNLLGRLAEVAKDLVAEGDLLYVEGYLHAGEVRAIDLKTLISLPPGPPRQDEMN